MQTWVFSFTTDKNCSDGTDLHFLACECERKPPPKKQDIIYFFLNDSDDEQARWIAFILINS